MAAVGPTEPWLWLLVSRTAIAQSGLWPGRSLEILQYRVLRRQARLSESETHHRVISDGEGNNSIGTLQPTELWLCPQHCVSIAWKMQGMVFGAAFMHT